MSVRLAFLALLACVSASAQPGQSQTPDKKSDSIVFKSEDGRILKVEDLKQAKGRFKFEVVGGDAVPDKAKSLHDQARKAGGAGNYKEAIALLEQASVQAPKWPYPYYDRAYTHLLMGEADKAREFYRKTLELSPRGYFTAITALDSLDREQKGDLPPGTYRAYLSLEFIPDAEQKASILQQMVKKAPQFAPAWKELSMLEKDGKARMADIEKGLAANPDAETKGTLLINKAMVMNSQGQQEAAVKLLGELALDPKSTYFTEHTAKAVLAFITKN